MYKFKDEERSPIHRPSIVGARVKGSTPDFSTYLVMPKRSKLTPDGVMTGSCMISNVMPSMR
ncbi:unnamed protein product [Penicillium roqueforti FM164]|uniref:Genomic scaffold, ProqFM164S01 n=1 Tax=Penicillium roqueforti (strain FM164) TaxID=1365484 RepID=W6QD31_PENRF|nr:unnamed protein product [Penicillium roqueforti FM164]